MRLFYGLFVILMWLPQLAAAETVPPVEIRDSWIQEAPPGISPLAAYMQLVNHSMENVVLESVSGPAFGRIEIHESRIEGDVAKMQHRDSLTLRAQQTVVLEPGGFHLMLFNPDRRLQDGDSTELTFHFKDKAPVTVEVDVVARRSRDDQAGHQHHHH